MTRPEWEDTSLGQQPGADLSDDGDIPADPLLAGPGGGDPGGDLVSQGAEAAEGGDDVDVPDEEAAGGIA